MSAEAYLQPSAYENKLLSWRLRKELVKIFLRIFLCSSSLINIFIILLKFFGLQLKKSKKLITKNIEIHNTVYEINLIFSVFLAPFLWKIFIL